MNDGGFFIGVILAAVIGIIGMNVYPITDNVRIEDYARAVKVCEPHDGVSTVFRPDYGNGEYVTLCKDGVKITQLTFQD